MKRKRITVQLQIDVPQEMSAAKAVAKLKVSAASITFGECKVVSEEELPEELLPFEQYDNDKIAIRNAILEVFKVIGKEHLCVKIWTDTYYDTQRFTHLATRPMLMDIWANAKHPLHHKGRIRFRIHDGEIWNGQNQVKICPLADPKFEGLVKFIDEYYKPKPPKHNYMGQIGILETQGGFVMNILPPDTYGSEDENEEISNEDEDE